MRIAFWSPVSQFCSWNFSLGIPATLRRMGHEIVSDPETADLVIVCGPEHLSFMLPKKPTVFWYHETTGREDYDFGPQFEVLSRESDFNFFISRSDAERFGGHYLPPAVDTAIFNTDGAPPWEQRSHKIAFVGQMYPKRVKFIEEYRKLGGPEIELLLCEGSTPEETAKKLADCHRDTQIFVCLPQMSRSIPAKAVEAAACGCCVICPQSPDERELRYWVFYDESDPRSLSAAVLMMLGQRDDAAFSGDATASLSAKRDTLEKRLTRMLEIVQHG